MFFSKLGWSSSMIAATLAMPMIAQAGTFKTIYTFAGGNDAAAPEAALIANDGILYSTSSRGGPSDAGTVYSYNLATGTETVLTTSMLSLPYTAVLRVGPRLYGTSSVADNGAGNIFSYNLKTGVTKDLYAFPPGRNLANPGGLLKLGANLYGTAHSGGSSENGSIFSYNPKTAIQTTLYNFSGGADGKNPIQLLPIHGVLYGTTSGGGTNGQGSIFKFDTGSNTLTTLYSFSGAIDGSRPSGINYEHGLIYGTANFGGANSDGTVFTMDPATNKVSVLYTFVGGANGCVPFGKPAIYKGHLYSVAGSCGSGANQGTLFDIKISTGALTTLHVFANGPDGVSPGAGLLLNNGVLYGTASYGGQNNAGTIFTYTP